jgi:putative heme-binding domain-containing protein
MLKSLRELGASDANKLAQLLRENTRADVRAEALTSLAMSKNDAGPQMIEFWPEMNAVQRRSALRALTSSTNEAKLFMAALQDGHVHERDLDGEALEKLRVHLPYDAEVKALIERLSAEIRPIFRLDGKNDSYVDANLTLNSAFTVECWVRLAPGISNEDGILGVPGGADFNFADGHFRVYGGPVHGDRIIARKRMTASSWTHLAVTRDSEGVFRLYINGELDNTDERKMTLPFENMDIGRTTPGAGTHGELAEFRLWKRERTAEEIRNEFDRTFEGEERPSDLVYYSASSWKPMHGSAEVVKVADGPALLTGAKAREQQERFDRLRVLAEEGGKLEHGRAVFAAACLVCHSVNGEGGQIGPVLNGAGASGTDTLLRAILTPSAAMEAGYRNYRIHLKDGEMLDGFLVRQDESTVVLRQPNLQDQRILKDQIRRADFTERSLMPDGLLEAMSADDVRDLFAYLKSLK